MGRLAHAEQHLLGEVQGWRIQGVGGPRMVDLEAEPMLAAIKSATRAFGGKAAHYAALAHAEGVPVPPAALAAWLASAFGDAPRRRRRRRGLTQRERPV